MRGHAGRAAGCADLLSLPCPHLQGRRIDVQFSAPQQLCNLQCGECSGQASAGAGAGRTDAPGLPGVKGRTQTGPWQPHLPLSGWGGDTLHRRWRTEGPPPQRQARLLSLDLGDQGPSRASRRVMGAASSSLSVHHPGLWFQLPRNWKFTAHPWPIQESQIPGTSDLAGCRGNPKPTGPGCGPEGDSCLGPGVGGR